MKKIFAASILAASLAVSANASADDACEAVLCLGGMILGGDGGSECSDAIKSYFDIKKYRKGDFSPSRTKTARGDFLNQCNAPDAAGNVSAIQEKWGGAFSM